MTSYDNMTEPPIADQAAYDQLKTRLDEPVFALRSSGADQAAISVTEGRDEDLTTTFRFGELVRSFHGTSTTRAWLTSIEIVLSELQSLEEAGWRQLVARAFSLSTAESTIALAVKDGLAWLVYADGREPGESLFFLITGDRPVTEIRQIAGPVPPAFDLCAPALYWPEVTTPPPAASAVPDRERLDVVYEKCQARRAAAWRAAAPVGREPPLAQRQSETDAVMTLQQQAGLNLATHYAALMQAKREEGEITELPPMPPSQRLMGPKPARLLIATLAAIAAFAVAGTILTRLYP